MRTYIIPGNEENTKSLLQLLAEQGVQISANCGGRGTCGCCKVKVQRGRVPITAQDKDRLTEEELHAGIRLACRCYPREELEVALELTDEYQILTEHMEMSESSSSDFGYQAAVDLGTTTVVAQLLHPDGYVLSTKAVLNPQRSFGADVVTRMAAANEGKGSELQIGILRTVQDSLRFVCDAAGILPTELKRIAIAGNTVMTHLLLGYSCEKLGVYPFTPVNIALQKRSACEVFSPVTEKENRRSFFQSDTEVVIFPGISAFVGGDITAGMLATRFVKSEEVNMLLDLGTNGEMAIGGKNGILVTSVAAGPAFEGGNISCGTGSVPGAIEEIEIYHGTVTACRTISDKPPVGLCGSGVISLTSELLQDEIVNETGRMCDPYFKEGFEFSGFRFTQKDIREVQLAKAAVRAGAEILEHRIGATEVKNVWLAGGFGKGINTEKAIHIGMFPQEFSKRIRTVGNSCLNGVKRYLTQPEAEEELMEIVRLSTEINLACDKEFNDLYMDYMGFEER